MLIRNWMQYPRAIPLDKCSVALYFWISTTYIQNSRSSSLFAFKLITAQKKICIQSDVTFFMVMSVSVLSNPIHTAGLFCNQLSLPGFFFLQQLLSSTVCFLGDWHWLPYCIFREQHWKIGACFLPVIQEMGSARLSQSQETVRYFNLYPKVNILFYI